MGSGVGGADGELRDVGSGGDDGDRCENDVGSTEEVPVPDPEDAKPRLLTISAQPSAQVHTVAQSFLQSNIQHL